MGGPAAHGGRERGDRVIKRTRVRADKPPGEADTLGRVREIYARQVKNHRQGFSRVVLGDFGLALKAAEAVSATGRVIPFFYLSNLRRGERVHEHIKSTKLHEL